MHVKEQSKGNKNKRKQEIFPDLKTCAQHMVFGVGGCLCAPRGENSNIQRMLTWKVNSSTQRQLKQNKTKLE